jgi:hypothetical protein
MAELLQRLDDSRGPQPHTLLPDAHVPPLAWAVATSNASHEGLRMLDRPGLQPIQV